MTREEAKKMFESMETGPVASMLPSIKGLTDHERRRYSLRNLINHQLERQRHHIMSPSEAHPAACLEDEISQSIAADLKILPPPGGSFVPYVMGAGLDTKSNANGAYTVGTKLLDFIDYLRAKNVCLRLGAQMLDGVNSGIALPVQSSGSTASWTGENPGADVSQTDSTFSQITPSAKTLQSTSAYSRQLLSQSSIAIEEFLRSDLAAATAVGLDLAAINGTGSSNQPLGLMRTSGIGSYAMGIDGAAPTAVALAALESAIADANADVGPLAWATTPVMRSKLRQVPLFTGSSLPCWQGDEGADQLLGSLALVSKAVPQGLTKGANSDCHAIIAGCWSSMTIVQYGALAIVVDEFSSKKRNLIEITTHAMFDVVVRRPSSFAVISDARNV